MPKTTFKQILASVAPANIRALQEKAATARRLWRAYPDLRRSFRAIEDRLLAQLAQIALAASSCFMEVDAVPHETDYSPTRLRLFARENPVNGPSAYCLELEQELHAGEAFALLQAGDLRLGEFQEPAELGLGEVKAADLADAAPDGPGVELVFFMLT